ncbi:MAG: hypothetical protein V4736_11520 [Bdellovibrionota bacterium]
MKLNSRNEAIQITLQAALLGAVVAGVLILGSSSFAAGMPTQATANGTSKLQLLTITNPKKDASAVQAPMTVAQNSTATAGSPASSLTTTVEATSPEGAAKPWAIEMNLERSATVIAEKDPNSNIATSITVIPSYKLTDKLTLSARTDIEKTENGQRETKFADSSLTLSLKGFKLSPTFSTVHFLAGVVPTSEKSQQDDKLKGAASLTNRIVGEFAIGTYSYSLGFRRNVHEFEVSRDGKPTIKQTLSHRLLGETKLFGSKFSFAHDLTYRNGWTYNDSQRQSFTFGLDLAYAATEKFSTYIGTTNEGSALRANGRDSNLELYNENTSVLRAGLTYVL